MSQYKSSNSSSRLSRGYGDDGGSAGMGGASRERQQRAQTARSMSGIHQAVSREQVEVRRAKPAGASRSSVPADDEWNWEAQPAASDFDERGSSAAQPAQKRRKKKSAAESDSYSDAEMYSSGASAGRGESLEDDDGPSFAEAGTRVLSADEVSAGTSGSEGAARRKKKPKARLAEAGTQMLDAPQYDDEYSGGSGGRGFAEVGTQMLDAPRYEDEYAGGGAGSGFASADTGSIEAPQYDDAQYDDGYADSGLGGRGQRGFAAAGTQMLDAPQYDDDAGASQNGAFSSDFAHEGTNLLDMNAAALDQPPPQQGGFAWPVSDARSGTQTLDAALDAGLMETPQDEALGEDGEEKPKNFDVSEDATIEVVIWNLLRQIVYNVAVFLRDHVTPLRDSMERYIERSKAIQENQNAAMSPQGRRLMRAAMAATVLFVAGLSVYVIYDTKKEKVPPIELAKLLYPYGPHDGSLNGKPFAGFVNVDFKYLQREPCSEGQTQANCFAYEYKARNLENFSGKMIIGVNQDGQWMLFNPPKDLVAAAQAKRRPRRR